MYTHRVYFTGSYTYMYSTQDQTPEVGTVCVIVVADVIRAGNGDYLINPGESFEIHSTKLFQWGNSYFFPLEAGETMGGLQKEKHFLGFGTNKADAEDSQGPTWPHRMLGEFSSLSLWMMQHFSEHLQLTNQALVCNPERTPWSKVGVAASPQPGLGFPTYKWQ